MLPQEVTLKAIMQPVSLFYGSAVAVNILHNCNIYIEPMHLRI